MNKYIEINENNEIIDVFFDWQKEKMQSSTKILLEEDTTETKHKINGKSISEEFGCFIFLYNNGTITEKTQSEIETSAEYIIRYKKIKRDELKAYIESDSITDGITKTIPEIKIKWQQFKTNSSNWTTKQEIDDAFNEAVTWLQS